MFVSSTPELHRCSGCKELKPQEDFAWRRRRILQLDTYCRACRRAYGREHYLKHKQRYIDQARARTERVRLERTRYLIEYYKDHQCVDCGEGDPLVLEFDHLGDKEFEVGTGLAARNWESILAEIAKCEVVCSNCHRRRTFRRRGSVRAMLVDEEPEA